MIRSQSINGAVRVLQRAAALALLTIVAACTAGGPSTTQTQQTTPGSTTSNYTGPQAATPDVTSFKVNLWDHISTSDKCGGCHHQGGQSPMFARSDDINLAYEAANPLVNFQQPEQSKLVTQVASGHNCWVADPKACADEMLTWIKAWIGSGAGSNTGVTVTPPNNTAPVAGGKQFPPTAELGGDKAANTSFQQTVYPLLTKYCAGCHSPAAASPQTPFFAGPDVDAAYIAAQDKIDLNTPENSRFVVRLRDEHHNCWATTVPADCDGSSKAMLAAIKTFADAIQVTTIDPTLLLSMGLKLKDGTVASGGNRSEAAVIAKYEFKTGGGTTAFDTSGVDPAAHLLLSGDVSWVGGWGININKGGKAQASTASSAKITSMIASTGEYTIEAWVAPANVAQTSAWIVSYSGSDTTRNVTLAQKAMQYQAVTRSDKTDANGGKTPLLTDMTNFPAQAALTHLVLTYDPQNGQKIYENGVLASAKDTVAGGSLASWDNTFALVLGAETNGKDQWLGVIKFVAIHNRALTATQVMQNYNAGVGEKYFMLFDVTSLTGVPQSYIQVTASVLDNYAYLFTSPTFVSLNPNATVSNMAIKGIRYGVNGVLQTSGQSWAMVNANVTASGQGLANVGGIVAADKGADTDVMFLSFDQVGTHSHPYVIPVATPPAATYAGVTPAVRGVKNYAQINVAMSQITGVPLNAASVNPTTTPTVNALYNTLQQALPPTNDITAFVASAQTAISQLADLYCNTAINTATIRGSTFPNLDVSQTASTYFGNSKAAALTATQVSNRNLVITPLINRAVGGSTTNPTAATLVTTELNSLMDSLVAANGTTAGRTAQVAQAACSAVLGSAVVSMQ